MDEPTASLWGKWKISDASLFLGRKRNSVRKHHHSLRSFSSLAVCSGYELLAYISGDLCLRRVIFTLGELK
jgi:hypothetical protein